MVCLSTSKGQYIFEPASDGIATMNVLTFEEIDISNRTSKLFRSGILEFDEKEKDKIYKELNIDYKDILFHSDIDSLILNASDESISTVKLITNEQVLERVNARLVYLKKDSSVDVSHRMESCIKMRRNELRKNQLRSKIFEVSNDTNDATTTRITELEEQVKSLMSIIGTQNKKDTEIAVNEGAKETEAPPSVPNSSQPVAKRGRPKKKPD